MPKSPQSSKLSDFKASKKSRELFAKRKRSASSDRRQFLKGAGMAVAAAIIPRKVKAAYNIEETWQKAVALLAPEQVEGSNVSLSTPDWQSQLSMFNWCWAATTWNLLRYYTGPLSIGQCDVVDNTFNTICHPSPSHSCCESNARADSYCNSYGSVSVAYNDSHCGSSSAWNDITAYIDNTGPVVTFIGACTGGAGGDEGGSSDCDWSSACENCPCSGDTPNVSFAHYLTIIGYYFSDSDSDQGFYVFDPWPNDGRSGVEYIHYPEANSWPQYDHAVRYGACGWWDTINS